MEAQHTDGISVPVSVWTSLIKSDEVTKCIVVIEPVQKIAANVTISNRVGSSTQSEVTSDQWCHLKPS